ncbi:hypothetical protein HK102_000756 [Quaeritorhiza haematococci]|nr:hypothetical protein HK102_000756 [Quaeritorhiza haematococci]
MLIKSFSAASLRKNLTIGTGSGIQVPALRAVNVVFGSDNCATKPALTLFYVNELPRLYNENRHINFTTETKPESNCSLSVTFDNDETKSVDLKSCATPLHIFERLWAQYSAHTNPIETPTEA